MSPYRKQRRQRVDEDDPMRTSRENLSTAIRLSRAAHQADQGTAEQVSTFVSHKSVGSMPGSMTYLDHIQFVVVLFSTLQCFPEW